MAVDTPATIAVIGAGPLGIETALYGRFLGYNVQVFEVECVGANVRRAGDTQMPTPFAQNHSSLGLAALTAQDPAYQPPADEEHLTAHQWLDGYVLPLSRTDLVAECVRTGWRVVKVAGRPVTTTEPEDGEDDQPLCELTVHNADDEHEECSPANVIIDASNGEPPIQYAISPESPAAAYRHALGSKSQTSNTHSPFQQGLDQIRELFAVIGDRTDLDLYAGARKLP